MALLEVPSVGDIVVEFATSFGGVLVLNTPFDTAIVESGNLLDVDELS